MPAQAVGQFVQPFQAALGALAQQVFEGALLFFAGGIRRFRLGVGLIQPAGDAFPFRPQDVVHPRLEVVHHRVQVALLELLAALVFEAFHQLAEVGHLVAVPVGHPVAEQVAQGPGQVAVLQQVVGDGVHNVAGVGVKNLLGAIPEGVAVALVEHSCDLSGGGAD